MNTIFKRKSVRNYTSQAVSREQLEQLVKAGMAAPTAMDKKPWAFVAIDDREVIDKLGNEIPFAKVLLGATAVIVVCGDMNKALDGAERDFWIQDCSAATQNILLEVEDMGLGAVWIAGYPAEDRVKIISGILNLPEHIVPLAVLSIGYPDPEGDDTLKDKWNPGNLKWNRWE